MRVDVCVNEFIFKSLALCACACACAVSMFLC